MDWQQNKVVGLVAVLVTLLCVTLLVFSLLSQRTRQTPHAAAVQRGREWQDYERQLGRPPTKAEAEAFFSYE